MRDHSHYLFITDRIDSETLSLEASEAHHAVSVLRVSIGDTLHATDGKGSLFLGKVIQADKKAVTITIDEKKATEKIPCTITLAVGIPDRDHFESILEQAVPLGVDRIIPVIFHYCQKKWWTNDWDKLHDRFTRKMITAMKQSLYPWLPSLSRPIDFQKWIVSHTPGPIIVADPDGKSIFELCDSIRNESALTCVVGPPGGFDKNESDTMIHQTNSHFLKIAQTRLRTELASIVAVSQLLSIYL